MLAFLLVVATCVGVSEELDNSCIGFGGDPQTGLANGGLRLIGQGLLGNCPPLKSNHLAFMPTFAHRLSQFSPRPCLLRTVAVLGITSVVLSIGCVRRRMTVRTNPPGATVSVDNQVIGTTPAATSFVYYGTRELRIEKDGYRTETVLRKINPPWYQLPGLDFISESLWPGEIRDERIIEVELVPKEIEKTDTVVDRADSLRSQSLTGMVTAPN